MCQQQKSIETESIEKHVAQLRQSFGLRVIHKVVERGSVVVIGAEKQAFVEELCSPTGMGAGLSYQCVYDEMTFEPIYFLVTLW